MTATDPSLRSDALSGRPHLAYAVGRFHTVLRAEMSRRLAPEGLTVPEFTALSVLSARGGLSNAELARRSFVTPQAMNQVLASLEDKELVSRPAPGEAVRGHHRARGAKLTARGRRAVARAQALVDEIEDRAFAPLSAAERRELTGVLGAAAQRLAAGAGPSERAEL
ncbi:MAG TPA: MarR family transcriptional regulator [Solirubrobacteraceae bacterium]|nr:MarR family transcriptional regulator [Solirubrobacteraceae bacterium]